MTLNSILYLNKKHVPHYQWWIGDFMILDIKPIHFDGCNCIEDIMISIADHYNREYQLTFYNCLLFRIQSDQNDLKKLLGERIYFPHLEELNEKFRQYCGIKCKLCKAESHKEIINAIMDQLQIQMPVGISINTYWCPWHSGYKNISINHYCLVVGIDSDTIYCIDPALNNKVNTLSFDDFINGYEFYTLFEVTEVNEFRESDKYLKLLDISIFELMNNKIYDDILNFANGIEYNFNFTSEFEKFKISAWHVPILRSIGSISGGIKLYCQFLNLVSQKTDKQLIQSYIPKMECIASKWNTIKGILVKSYYTDFNEKIKEELVSIIRNIADDEISVIISIKNSIKYSPLKVDSNAIPTQPFKLFSSKVLYIDIEDKYNNNAFCSSLDNKHNADLTGTGECFLTNNLPDIDKWIVEYMQFRFPTIKEGTNNNISCKEQVILVPQDAYLSIQLLACAECGNFSDYLTIKYIDDSYENLIISFSDWGLEEPVYNELIAWKGNVIKRKGTEYMLRNKMYKILAHNFDIKRIGIIKNIVLPYCPNIHIFAISLCRA